MAGASLIDAMRHPFALRVSEKSSTRPESGGRSILVPSLDTTAYAVQSTRARSTAFVVVPDTNADSATSSRRPVHRTRDATSLATRARSLAALGDRAA